MLNTTVADREEMIEKIRFYDRRKLSPVEMKPCIDEEWMKVKMISSKEEFITVLRE